MPTRADAITEAGRILAHGRALRDSLPPRQAAELAHCTGGPNLDEIENKIRSSRGLPLLSEQRAA